MRRDDEQSIDLSWKPMDSIPAQCICAPYMYVFAIGHGRNRALAWQRASTEGT